MIKWQNKEIFIPQNLQAFIYGKDTIINYHNNKYNILNYIDTSGCTECHMQLFEQAIRLKAKKYWKHIKNILNK